MTFPGQELSLVKFNSVKESENKKENMVTFTLILILTLNNGP